MTKWNKWDRLNTDGLEDGKEYLVYTSNGKILKVCYDNYTDSFDSPPYWVIHTKMEFQGQMMSHSYEITCCVTHWTELPKPPEDKDELD